MPFFPKYFPGGAEIQSYFIARHMLSKGWSVHFSTENCGQPTAKLENEDGIWVHKLKQTRFFNPLRCWRFYRELLQANADIYYQRGRTHYTLLTSLVAKALGRKFVWATSLDPDCEGNRFRISLSDEGVRGIKHLILLPDAWIRDAMASVGRKGADVIVVQSEAQKARMKERLGLESLVIKTGHPILEEIPEKESPPLVIWIANIKRRKRPELFIELARECSDLSAKFVLGGKCSDPCYHYQIRRLCRGLKNLELTGALPFSRSNELLAAASILVNTSVREGFSNTFVQAWLRETPVVSLTVDSDGVLEREKIGIHSGSFQKMVQDVRHLLSDERLRKEMGQRAKAYAVREHNLVDKLRQYTELFESLI